MDDDIDVTVASCVIRVIDLERSVSFYRDVFSCRVGVRSEDTVLLLTPKGFQLYLQAKKPYLPRNLGVLGVQQLVWSTSSQSDLERIMNRLRRHDPSIYTHTDAATGVTFLDARGPDSERIIVTYPSPHELARTDIPERLRA